MRKPNNSAVFCADPHRNATMNQDKQWRVEGEFKGIKRPLFRSACSLHDPIWTMAELGEQKGFQ